MNKLTITTFLFSLLLFNKVYADIVTEIPSGIPLEEKRGLFYEVNSRTPFSGISVVYFESGQLSFKGNYKDGKEDGLYESYDDNGQLESKGNYKDGKEDGLYERYDDNGQLQYQKNYKDGELDGLTESYFENGQLEFRLTYKDGKEDGLYERYFENGQLQYRKNYKDGELDGLTERYFENGQLWYTDNHIDGKLVFTSLDTRECIMDGNLNLVKGELKAVNGSYLWGEGDLSNVYYIFFIDKRTCFISPYGPLDIDQVHVILKEEQQENIGQFLNKKITMQIESFLYGDTQHWKREIGITSAVFIVNE